MQQDYGANFIETMRKGQNMLAAAPDNLRQIGEVFSQFGRALGEFSQGKVGIACVTKEGHQPIAGDFAVGTPMSVILVSHVRPETPNPIIADLEVAHYGYPVTFTLDGSRVPAFSAAAVSDILTDVAGSSVFAAALRDLMAIEAPKARLDS